MNPPTNVIATFSIVATPAAIERARAAHPVILFVYAWPIPLPATARFLADHVRRSAASPLP